MSTKAVISCLGSLMILKLCWIYLIDSLKRRHVILLFLIPPEPEPDVDLLIYSCLTSNAFIKNPDKFYRVPSAGPSSGSILI
jgi:hypothetical protein